MSSAPLVVVQNPAILDRILESLHHDSTTGRAALAQLTRTCTLLLDPVLNVLWRELDSLIPLLALFPPHLLRIPRRPQVGFTAMPEPRDWTRFLYYAAKVHKIAYEQSSGSIAPSIFPILDRFRPQAYLLPNLQSLAWRAETLDGLARSLLFMHPDLKTLNIEITAASPAPLFAEISSRARLTALSLTSRQTSPDAVMELLRPQHSLQKLRLNAPGCISPEVGRWIAFHPTLTSLAIDFSTAEPSVVENFFAHSRQAVEVTSATADSAEVAMAPDPPSLDLLSANANFPRGSCPDLTNLRLTGDASTLAFFMGHLNSRLDTIHVDIDYPAGEAGWKYLFDCVREHYASTLTSFRIGASAASVTADRQRTAARGGLPVLRHFSLEKFPTLLNCTVLDFQLPESAYIRDVDLIHVAETCPNVEFARLCAHSRFPVALGAPKLTLEGIAALTERCKHLHTLYVVVSAAEGSEGVLLSSEVSSSSLTSLHLSNSWAMDPFQIALLLSHLTPALHTLTWDASSKNRHATTWAKVQGYLPHLQALRRRERMLAQRLSSSPSSVDEPEQLLPGDAEADEEPVVAEPTKAYADQAVWASPFTESVSVQVSPNTNERAIEAKPRTYSVAVGATPTSVDANTMTESYLVEQSVQSSPVELKLPGALALRDSRRSSVSLTSSPRCRSPLLGSSPFHTLQSSVGDHAGQLFSLLFWPFSTLFLAFPYSRYYYHFAGETEAADTGLEEKDAVSISDDNEDP